MPCDVPISHLDVGHYEPAAGQNLTVWRRNYFFLILAHPVYKMRIIQEPNSLKLLNKLYFEEEKTENMYHV